MSLYRVLHVGKYYSPFMGGIENFTRDLVESRPYQENVEVAIIAHQHTSSSPTTKEMINGVKVVRVKRQAVMLYTPICLSFLKELNGLIAEFKPNVIHIHMPNLSAFACLLSSSAKKLPWVIHWHADVLGSLPDWRVKLAYNAYQFLEARLLARAVKIIATSESYMLGSKPLAPFQNKVGVIPLGLNMLDRSYPRSQDRHASLSLLMIGRLTYYKGHELLINAIKQIEHVNLTVIGTGELESSLKSLTVELKLESRVTFLGSVSSEVLRTEVASCDLLCLPSIEKTEAFGLVLLEAARQKRPALTANVSGSGMSWVVQHLETGIIVEPNSLESLSNALKFVLKNPELCHLWGENAHKRFHSLFKIDEVASQILSVYNESVESRDGS